MEREEVIKNLRACLISSKGGVKMEDLNRIIKCSLMKIYHFEN